MVPVRELSLPSDTSPGQGAKSAKGRIKLIGKVRVPFYFSEKFLTDRSSGFFAPTVFFIVI